MRQATGMSTAEGLINEVRDPVEDGDGKEIDPGVADKRLLVYESEFAQPLIAMQRQGNTLEPIVRPAWDGTVLRTLVKNSPLMATGAHISILGNITQEELEIALSQSSLFNGFANRFLWGTRETDKVKGVWRSVTRFDNGLGWETCSHLRNLLSKIFANAKKWGHHSGENPVSGVDLPEKVPASKKQALNPDQVVRLLAVLKEPVRTMVLLAILTGLRVGEILGLRWQDVDLDRGELRVEQSFYRGCLGSPKTKGSRRTLPLPAALRRVLASHSCRSVRINAESLVFASRKGTALSDTNLLNRHLKPAGRHIGAPWLSWHTFRRRHATLLQLAGGSAKDAQAQLGHSHITITLGIYTIPVPAHQRAAVEKLSLLVTNGDEFGAEAKTGISHSGMLQ